MPSEEIRGAEHRNIEINIKNLIYLHSQVPQINQIELESGFFPILPCFYYQVNNKYHSDTKKNMPYIREYLFPYSI
jgi:hypothetical protein